MKLQWNIKVKGEPKRRTAIRKDDKTFTTVKPGGGREDVPIDKVEKKECKVFKKK